MLDRPALGGPDALVPASERHLPLADEAATAACGARLGAALAATDTTPFVIYVAGELGTGKTTFVRGALRELGITGAIHSPTYTLVETYETPARRIAHLDLYRLTSSRELEPLAVREFLLPGHVMFIEWPERGAGGLPAADLSLQLDFASPGRTLAVRASSAGAEPVVQEWFR